MFGNNIFCNDNFLIILLLLLCNDGLDCDHHNECDHHDKCNDRNVFFIFIIILLFCCNKKRHDHC
ncbi:hypothetical protein [Romboutsia sp. MSSM.1001216sp_RTP31141st1_G3_RTP31141_220114]|uniref:hypothetical protein n=1 Tax=unclassified Romboutsia TaxID=2626894 RepID=UPI0031B57F74